jgi:hypothetical protein
MSDWNEQAAPNNNNPSQTIRNSKFVGNEARKAEGTMKDSGGVTELVNKDMDSDDLNNHLLNRQPGM